MNRSLWQLDDVTLAGRSQPRLDRVSISIEAGVTAVIGASGAGKSSLLNLLVGFEIPAHGNCVSNLKCGQGLPVFWVPQNAGLWPHLSVAEHLNAVSKDASRNKQLLAQFELAEKQTAKPDTLSAGERGRLSLARALASDADVLVMDEPLANVDPVRAQQYWRVIRGYCQSRSLVFATHSVDTVLREADRVICLDGGKLLYSGDKQILYDAPDSIELAELLGPANWFSAPVEAEQWLQGTREGTRCYRPEHLKIEENVESTIQITAARYGSSVGELELFDERSRSERTMYHRVNGRRFKTGDRIVLRVLSLLLLACCLTVLLGCTPSTTAPPLSVSQINHWSMPPAGKVIPAPRSVRYGDEGQVYVLDNAGRVLVYSAAGKLERQWKMPAFDVGKPEGICLLRDGRIAVTDTHYHRVVFFDHEGRVVGMHGERGREPGQFIYPVAITQDPDENYYICEYGDNDRVQKFAVDGTLLLTFGSFGTEPGQFQRPSGIIWDDHQIYVADAINNRIQVFSDIGEFQFILAHSGAQPQLHYPYDLIAGTAGQLFVVEYGAGRVTELSKAGRVISRWGEIGSAKGQLNTPWGLAMNQDGDIVVADTGNRRLVEIQR